MATVWVVDDEPHIRFIFGRLMRDEGHAVREAASGEEALALLAEGHPDLVFLDYRLGGMNGLETLRALRAAGLEAPVTIITAHESVRDAVALVKEGAFDYLAKPLLNDEIVQHARRALEIAGLRRRVAGCEVALERLRGGAEIVGTSPALAAALETARAVAAADIPVLLAGESGTGKDLLAQYLHEAGPRRTAPFVVLDCGAIPETLAESELFGHEKGAFSGADGRRRGKFEAADRGTLFLDEVGNASPGLQAKLLRLIETKTFTRLGSHAVLRADVRIVAATNRDLGELAGRGGFRPDLYYRLRGAEIRLPPLRERGGDVDALLAHFLVRCAAQQHRDPPPRLSPAAAAALRAYSWPGNVRELGNFVERSVLLCGEEIGVEALPPEIRRAGEAGASRAGGGLRGLRESSSAAAEKSALEKALERSGGNKRAAARELGIDPKTLYRLLAKHSL